MKSPIEIGQAVRRLPYRGHNLSINGTKLLESCGDLSRAQLAMLCGLFGGGCLQDVSVIEQLLGIPEGDFDKTVFFGYPDTAGARRHLTIYERHRNINLFADGSGNFVTPTPSGQKLLIQPFNVKGEHAEINSRSRYADRLEDTFGTVSSDSPGSSSWLKVVTHPNSRQVSAEWRWPDNKNFAPMPSLVEMAKNGRPGEVDMDKVNELLGKWIHNPHASGWLVGFDQFAGEAIVSSEDFPYAGFEHWQSTESEIVKDLEGLYAIELKPWKESNFKVYRNAIGQVFLPERVDGGYKLCPASRVMAFAPIEVSGLGSHRPPTLAEALGLDWKVGLRALGGYWTKLGGRIPLSF